MNVEGGRHKLLLRSDAFCDDNSFPVYVHIEAMQKEEMSFISSRLFYCPQMHESNNDCIIDDHTKKTKSRVSKLF